MPHNYHALLGIAVGLLCAFSSLQAQEDPEKKVVVPVRILLISGGASHEFEKQREVLKAGLRERIAVPIEWRILSDDSGRSDVKITGIERVVGAEEFDLVIHHHCFPRVGDPDYIEQLLDLHRAGKPAILIHGSLRSFETIDSRWRELCGVATSKHEREREVEVLVSNPSHPVMSGSSSWTSMNEELYLIDQVFPGVDILAESEGTPVIWAHAYGPARARVVATSLGNDLQGSSHPGFLDTLARGILWALERPLKETFIEVEPASSLSSIDIPWESVARLKGGYSETQNGVATAMSANIADGHLPSDAIDGDGDTYWEAQGVGPSFWQVELSSKATISAIALHWKSETPLSYQVEGSVDGLTWSSISNKSEMAPAIAPSVELFAPMPVAFLRVTFSETRPGARPGIREVAVYAREEEIPAAYRKVSASLIGLRTAGPEVPEKNIRLVPNWSVGEIFKLPSASRFVEMQPRADGSLFVMTESDEEAEIFLTSDSNERGLVVQTFLSGIQKGASLTWDGEWVYLLEGVEFSRLRTTSANGAADERRWFGRILILTILREQGEQDSALLLWR